jgi:phosphoribosylformylglycinamidine cyclo-ligase
MTDEARRPLTYAAAGVDIDAREATAKRFGAAARSTHGPEVIAVEGTFAGLFRLGAGYRDPVLVGTTDGVGTKVLIAATMGEYASVGRDLVNANVNDLITTGARPLFFLDYLATTDLPHERRLELVEGIAAACREQGIALIGGETADMPDVYRPGDFDLAGFAVGVVERDEVIDGSQMAPGDVLLAVPSSGLHTNGYALVREVWGLGKGLGEEHDRQALVERYEELGGASLGEALLAVHVPYEPVLRPLMGRLKGIAHISGGGIPGNLPRILGERLGAELDGGSWEPPALFGLVQRAGKIPDAEMFRTFNMGAGMILAVDAGEADAVLAALPAGSWRIGRVVERGDGPAVRGLPEG